MGDAFVSEADDSLAETEEDEESEEIYDSDSEEAVSEASLSVY